MGLPFENLDNYVKMGDISFQRVTFIFCPQDFVIVVIHIYRVPQNKNSSGCDNLFYYIFSMDSRKAKFVSKAYNARVKPQGVVTLGTECFFSSTYRTGDLTLYDLHTLIQEPP